MNHIYRSIWNATLGCWVAAPENARAGGKASRSTRCARTTVGEKSRAVFAVIPLVVACSLAWPVLGHSASVTGEQTVQGSLIIDLYDAGSSDAWIGGTGDAGGTGGAGGAATGAAFPGSSGSSGSTGTAGDSGVLTVLGTVNLEPGGTWTVGGTGGAGGTGGFSGASPGKAGGAGGSGGVGGTGGSGTLNIASGGTVNVATGAALVLALVM